MKILHKDGKLSNFSKIFSAISIVLTIMTLSSLKSMFSVDDSGMLKLSELFFQIGVVMIVGSVAYFVSLGFFLKMKTTTTFVCSIVSSFIANIWIVIWMLFMLYAFMV